MSKINKTMGKWLGVTLAMVIFIGVSAANGATPLVDVAWIKANGSNAGVVILDTRSKPAFLRGHIPGAVTTSYGKGGWRVLKDKVPGMLPSAAQLSKLVGSLGIDNNSHVVIAAPGNNSSDMGVATRLYWTFKVAGHDNVSILDGGMKAYLAAVDKDKKPTNPLDKGPNNVGTKTFNVSFRMDMIPSTADVKAALDRGVIMVDHRPNDQYLGVNRHPKAKIGATIPGALNMPNNWLTENGGGVFRSKKVLTLLYKAAGVPTSGEQINFCNTGHWASVGWFASSEILGNKEARMYDGSMLGWLAENMPTETKIKF
ncbi:MAG TPA: sulfurtransferase [Rhodospirillales bacterium]|nr:sulfurtransferase [Rhodospirillales bacterium]